MAEKKTAAKGYQKFKADLAAGTLGEVYIFCGEESYLREYYLKEVQKKLVPAGFEEFNFHRVAGKGLTMEELTEMTEAMPSLKPPHMPATPSMSHAAMPAMVASTSFAKVTLPNS